MVTIAEELEDLYPVDADHPIFMKGFVSGNYGMYNRHWLNTTSANIIAGMGLLRATGGAEHTCTEWGANCEVGYGVAGWDKTQVARDSTNVYHCAYASGDLIPVYPFAENAGAIFQGYVADTNGNWNADAPCDAGAVGTFLTGDLANRIYARVLYYIADTAETAQLVVLYIAQGMGG